MSGASPASAGLWRPIETAPRARERLIDLCLLNRRSGEQWRVIDCRWAGDWGWQEVATGRSICGKRWPSSTGAICFDPLCEDQDSIVATHWMVRPVMPTVVDGLS